jgi:replicative DNA helicase
MDSTHGANDDDQVASDAEQHLVAAMLLFPGASLHIGRLSPDEFYNPRHKVAFEAILALQERNEPVDLMTVSAEIHRRGMLEPVGGLAGLAGYLTIAPTGDNAGYYAGIVRERSFVRRLGVATDSTTSRLRTGADWRGELSTLKSVIDSLEDDSHEPPPTLAEVVTQELASIQSNEPAEVGIPTGLDIERACPAGIPIGYVTTVFGESGSFKSTVANNLIWNAAKAGHGVLHVSWEDSAKLTADRFIARESGVGYGRIAARQLDPHDRLVLAGIVPDELTHRVTMLSDVERNMASVIQTARHYKRTKSISLVVVDYLQIMDFTAFNKRHEDISDAVKMAQKAAVKEQLAFVLVSQVATDIPKRDNPRPQMEDCFGSGAIRQYSKLGISVFRPSKYCRVPTAKGPYSEYHALAQRWPDGPTVFMKDVFPRVIELGMDKNVMGAAPVVVHALVDPPTGRMEPFDPKVLL